MPDITISFTDAQWTRIVAASKQIKAFDEIGDVDESYIATKLKDKVDSWVKAHEEKVSADDF